MSLGPFYNVNTWLKENALKPRPRWLLQGILPAESIVWVSGPPKKGFKTWSTFLMAQCVASGHPYGIFHPPKPEHVLIVEEEGATIDTVSRWRKIEKGCFNNDFWQTDPYDGRLHWIHHSRMKVDDPIDVEEVCNYVKEHGIKLVIFDALTKMVQGDENSFRDTRAVCDQIDVIRACGATVLGIRHVSKDSTRPDTDIDDQDVGMRGHSVYRDVYDAHLAMIRNRMTDGLTMQCRYRDHAESAYNLHWNIDTCEEYLDDIGQPAHDPERYPACQTRTCDHFCDLLTCDHGAKLESSKRGKHDMARELAKNYGITELPKGEPLTLADLREAMGGVKKVNEVKALAFRSRLLDAGIIESMPDNKGFKVL